MSPAALLDPRPDVLRPPAHEARLLATLSRCAARVPLYRGVPAPGADARAALAAFPVLTKAALRAAFPHGLVPAGASLQAAIQSKTIELVGTSGTSGDRVQVLWDQAWWDAQERDGFRAHALADAAAASPGYREAVLATPACSGTVCHVGRRTREERTWGRILFLNETPDPGLWTDADVLRMADELEAHAPDALEGDPAYLALFAARLLRLGRRPYAPRYVDTSYALASRRHVVMLRRAFEVPVLDAYGSTECGFAFMECEAGLRHENHAWVHTEVLPLGAPGLEGTGRLLLTPLGNEWLNLVRYDPGDVVRPAAGPCACGRAGRLLEAVEGRLADLVQAADGRLLTPRTLDLALAPVDGLLHWRLVQRGPAAFELDLLATGLEPLDPAAARDALGGLLGVAPRTRVVTTVPVEASGKLRLAHAAHADLAAAAAA